MLFISYSRADVTATKSLAETLVSKGIDCWLDESNIPVGQAFVARLGQALQRSEVFLLLDTPSSRRSYWVSREVRTATRYRAEGRYHTLLRIYSAACEGGVTSHWDASLPLDTHTCDRTAELLALRSTPRAAAGPNGDSCGVSIASNGLGQPSNWSGRQDELRNLDEWWFGSSRGAWVQGLGGIGKSGLVQTWITALAFLGYEGPVNANVLHVPGREFVETDRTLGKLASWHPSAAHDCRLLFLDGYDEACPGNDAEGFLREALGLGSRVIVTSRSQAPPLLLQNFRSIALDTMSRRDAISVLADFGIGGAEGVEAASELNNHPVAFMLFARYVTSGKRTAAEALRDLRSMQFGDLARPGVQLQSTLQATLAASVRALTLHARRFLKALCAARDSRVVALAEFRTHLGPARPEAIRELARASLIEVDSLDTPTTIAIHPLVQHFVNEASHGLFEEADSVA